MASHDGWQRTVGGDWTREIGNGVKATVRIDHWEALLGEDDDLGYWSCGGNDVGMEFSSRAEAESYLQALLEDWAMESGDEFDSIEWGRYLSGESVRGVACGETGWYVGSVAPILELDTKWVDAAGYEREHTVPLNGDLPAKDKFSYGVKRGLEDAEKLLGIDGMGRDDSAVR